MRANAPFANAVDTNLHGQIVITSVQTLASLVSVLSLFAPLPVIRKVLKKRSTGTFWYTQGPHSLVEFPQISASSISLSFKVRVFAFTNDAFFWSGRKN